ncbi:MAG: histidine kinase [Bacteroidetes bacterium]|nr:histidine kinase [Bacteroidota bacterium]
MTRSFLTGKKLRVLLHLVVWSVLFILPAYMLYGNSARDRSFMIEVWFQLACFAVLFYTSYNLLAPRFFFTGKKVMYFITAALMIIIFTLFLGLLHDHFVPDFRRVNMERQLPSKTEWETGRQGLLRPPPNDKLPPPVRNWPLFNFLLSSFMVTGLSLGLRFSEKLQLNEKLRKEAEKEKLHTELALLKHQINPHFLFNTLNSIYSLALIQSDKTAEAVMMLSDMMRYVIQDVEHETVPLELELEYVVHYVELQKMRLAGNIDIRVNIEGDPGPYMIPPMILVPFVENAFKYGTSSHENAVISIDLKIAGGLLTFNVSNHVFAGREKAETFGIGIQNTRQRLNLMYPGRHKLVLSNTGTIFMVNLEISLA